MSKANPRYRRDNAALDPIVNNVYRVRVIFTQEQQTLNCSFFYLDGAPPNSAKLIDLENLALGFCNPPGMIAPLVACMSTDGFIDSVQVDCPNRKDLVPYEFAVGQAGTNPSKALPSTDAVTILRYTSRRGQCGRGRISVPSVPITSTTRSMLSTTTAHDTLASKMLTTITQSGTIFTPCLFSKAGSRTHPTPGAMPLVSCFAETVIGSAQRRKIGRGK